MDCIISILKCQELKHDAVFVTPVWFTALILGSVFHYMQILIVIFKQDMICLSARWNDWEGIMNTFSFNYQWQSLVLSTIVSVFTCSGLCDGDVGFVLLW